MEDNEILTPPTPIIKTKEYKLVSDNKTFNAKLSLSSSLILIEIRELEKIMAMFDEEDIIYLNLDKYQKREDIENIQEEKNKTKEKIYDKKSN